MTVYCRGCRRLLDSKKEKVARQRCSTCYERFRDAEVARGVWESPVPAERSRDHIRKLNEAGMAFTDMARRSGLHDRFIRNLLDGAQAKVLPSTERIILAIEFEHSPGRRVDATGTRRRLQGLHALGYDFEDLAAEADVGVSTVRRIVNGDATNIWYAVHDRVVKVYAKLQIEPGPSDRARNRARRLGWISAWAWDDHDLDNPDAQPHVGDTSAPAVDEVVLLQIERGRRFKIPIGAKMTYAHVLIAREWTVADVDRALRLSSRQQRELRQTYGDTREDECSQN